MKRGLSRRAALAALCGLLAGTAWTGAAPAASGYPERNLTMVVPFGAGGGSDVLARTIAGVIKDQKLIPVEMLIENRPGSSGAKGYKWVADRKGDTSVLATVSVSFFTTPLLGVSPVSYRNFTPIAAISMSPYVLVVRADSKIKSLKDVPGAGRLTTGSVGVVSDAALLAQMLNGQSGSKIDVVPFEREGEITTGVLGGHLDMMFANPSEVLPMIEAGQLRPIAVSTAQRLKSMPDVPTFKDVGYDIEHVQLRAIVMPAGMPPEVVKYWEEVFRKVAASDEWREKYLDRFRDEPLFLDSKGLAPLIRQTNDRYLSVMKQLDIVK